MKRRMAIIMILILLLMFSTSCTSVGTDPASSGSNDDDTKNNDSVSELVYYTVNTDEELQRELYKPFEEKHNVKIKIVAIESTKFMENFMAGHNANQSIDVVGLNGQDVRFLANAGIIKDMSDMIMETDRFVQAALDPYIIGGKLYGIPTGSMGTSALYYNQKILDKYGLQAPKDYEELITISKTLAEEDISTIGFGGGTIYMWPMWFFQTFAQTSGNQSVERTLATLRGEAKFTDSDYVEAMKVLQKFGEDQLFQPGVNGVDSDGGKAIFSTGKSAMFYGGSWELPGLIETETSNPDEFQIGVVPFPIVDQSVTAPQQTGGSGLANAIYSKITSGKEELAVKFIEYISSDEAAQKQINETKDTFSVNVNIESSVKHPVIKELTEKFLPQTVTFLDWYWPPEITNAFQQNIQAVIGGQKDAEKAMVDIQKVFDELVENGYKFEK
jgi:raffinose/stachyose/melibiose transport system substrate-binding protein